MQKNYNENLVAGAAIRDDKGRRISKLFEASHPKMTVGYAKNLIMPDDPTEQEFNFRQAGGGVIEDGVAVIDKVKGNSVVWNQLLNRQRVQYVRINVVEDMGPTLKVQVNGRYPGILYTISLIKGHKYLPIFNITPANVYTSSEGFQFDVNGVKEYTSDSKSISVVFQDNQDYGAYPVEQTYEKPFFYDLTQMFGAGNEPTTYEEFLQRKPKVADEYAYNEGEIINSKVEAIKTSGVNLWDEQWEQGSLDAQGLPVATTVSIRSKEFNRCLPNCEICFSCQSAAAKLIYWYDVNKTFISRYEIPNSASIYGVTTSPANAYFFKIRNDKSTYNHDICVNLSNPTINGKYFPYEKHELDLSWVKDIKDENGVALFEDGLRGADDVFDEAKAKVATKRMGIIDLGNLDWLYQDRNIFLSSPIPNVKSVDVSDYGGRLKGVLCDKYVAAKSQSTTELQNGEWLRNTDKIYICDTNYADIVAFKEAVRGLKLIYKLAEPIEVEYDEKNLTYPVVAGGTEEAIASEPSSAFRADIGYGIDAVKTILDLKARVEALEGK